jgi:hypothetical protein
MLPEESRLGSRSGSESTPFHPAMQAACAGNRRRQARCGAMRARDRSDDLSRAVLHSLTNPLLSQFPTPGNEDLAQFEVT